MICLLFFFFLVSATFSAPIHLIDRNNRVIDILYELTGLNGPYEFTSLKERRGRPVVCKIDCAGKSYVVRFNEDDYKPARVDEVVIHRYAREKGFGPDIIYANDDEGIIIMEYFSTSQYEPVLMDKKVQIDKLIECVKKIHESTIECRPRDSFANKILSRFTYSSAVTPNIYDFDLTYLRDILRFFEQCIDKDVKPVFAHGDLHRFNIFLCNDDCYKAIDFETAYYDHPYVDLAHLAIFFGFEEQDQVYLLERYWGSQIKASDWLQFTIFKAFVLAKWALWMLESLPNGFLKTKESKEMFYVRPLTEFFGDPIEDKNPAWRYRAAVTALKEAERLLGFLQNSFSSAPIN